MLENNNSKIVFTRNELYDLVWSTPLLALSKTYFISDNGLRKICKRMNIPLPKAGHWMKLQFGKKVSVKALPGKYEGDEQVSLRLRTESDTSSSMKQVAVLVTEIKTSLGEILNVPEKLRRPYFGPSHWVIA